MARTSRNRLRLVAIGTVIAATFATTTAAMAINPSDWDRDDAKAHEAYLASGGSLTQKCLGKTVTISAASALVQGTSGNDVIVSRYVGAQVNGGDGDDIICAYNLNVDVYGGNGNDVIWGDSNAGQRLMGSGGNDVLFGWQGSGGHGQYFNGGTGADKIYGSRSADQIYGHDGNDSVYAADGDDSVHGGNGNDTLRGQGHDDSLYGDGGTDTLCGGNGTNRFAVDNNTDKADFDAGDTVWFTNGATTYSDIPSC
jgi:Ca2+-binding RTX toxin-like protein